MSVRWGRDAALDVEGNEATGDGGHDGVVGLGLRWSELDVRGDGWRGGGA